MRRLLFAMFAFTALLGAMFPLTAEARVSDPGKLIKNVSEDVLDMVRDAREMEDGEAYLKNNLQDYLDPYIDFDTFSQGVLGKYRKQVSAENKEAFASDFKETLVKLYAKSMLAFEVKEIAIAEIINPRPGMAQVTMHITSREDASFKAQYSLRKNDKGEWKVLNMILDGVNLGLTYRNQFYSAVESNDGDVSAAINNWSKVMEDVETVDANSKN